MGGCLIELVAQGFMNKHTTGNPQFSFFKKAYVMHTPFFKYNINVLDSIYNSSFTNDTNKEFNLNRNTTTDIKIKINKDNGDLLSNINMIVELQGDNIDMTQFIRGFAVNIIKRINLKIGGHTIERLDQHIINIYNEIWLKEAKRQYNDYLVGNKIKQGQKSFSVKLPLFFSRSYCKSIPLCALKYHDVDLYIKLNSINSLIKKDYLINKQSMDVSENNLLNNFARMDITDEDTCNQFNENYGIKVAFIGEYIILGDKEKQIFINSTLEYVFESITHDETFVLNNQNNKLRSSANMLVSEWYFMAQYIDSNFNSYNNENLKYVDLCNANINIVMNDVDRFEKQPSHHFLIEQNIKHHSNVPRTKNMIPILSENDYNLILSNPLYKSNTELLKDKLSNAVNYFEIDEGQYIHTYSHCLNPEDATQPSGSVNASRLTSIYLNINNVDTSIINKFKNNGYNLHLHLYYKYLNVLRYCSGMGGVVYSS